jgi:hypothetical protein
VKEPVIVALTIEGLLIDGDVKVGVTRVAEFDRTDEPVPVDVVEPVPPFAVESGF